MSRYVYANRRYAKYAEGCVHVEDRGYQFADGVYEVIALQNGCMVDEDGHMKRLDRSLSELRMNWPMSPRSMAAVMRELIQRNRIADRGMLYVQITRGVAPRNHAFPEDASSSLVMTARPLPALDWELLRKGAKVITVPDLRWERRDIKSVSLLPNVLARQKAMEEGAYEAWMVDPDGTITEGTASNAWIVTEGDELLTRQPTHAILNGITRLALLQICEENGVKFVERPFTVSEAKSAKEAFLTSTISLVKPVTCIDESLIGSGMIGPLTEKLLAFYVRHMREQGGNKA